MPDALARSFADSRRAMDDMPMEGTDFGRVVWDVERVVAAAEAIARRGELLHTVAAVDATDGSVVGFSELVVPGDGSGDGQHYGTAVLPEHRGKGLARWMKAAAVRHALERHPETVRVVHRHRGEQQADARRQRLTRIPADAQVRGVPARSVITGPSRPAVRPDRHGWTGTRASSPVPARPSPPTPSGSPRTSCARSYIGLVSHSGTVIGFGSPNSSATHSEMGAEPHRGAVRDVVRLPRAAVSDRRGHRAGRVGEFDPRQDPAVVGGGGQLPLAQQGQDVVGAAGAVEEAEAQCDALQPRPPEGELFLGAHPGEVPFQLRVCVPRGPKSSSSVSGRSPKSP